MELNFDNFFDFIFDNPVAVVDAYGHTCEPCQRFMKIIPRLLPQLEGKAVFGKFEVGEVPQLKQLYELTKVPTFLFFKDGELVHRVDGRVMPMHEIISKVDELNGN